MLLIFEKACARHLSKVSGMLDNQQVPPAQQVSKMTKMSKRTKLLSVNENLN